jgi:hypothetical protein
MTNLANMNQPQWILLMLLKCPFRQTELFVNMNLKHQKTFFHFAFALETFFSQKFSIFVDFNIFFSSLNHKTSTEITEWHGRDSCGHGKKQGCQVLRNEKDTFGHGMF